MARSDFAKLSQAYSLFCSMRTVKLKKQVAFMPLRAMMKQGTAVRKPGP